jgi:hypothetical protein
VLSCRQSCGACPVREERVRIGVDRLCTSNSNVIHRNALDLEGCRNRCPNSSPDSLSCSSAAGRMRCSVFSRHAAPAVVPSPLPCVMSAFQMKGVTCTTCAERWTSRSSTRARRGRKRHKNFKFEWHQHTPSWKHVPVRTEGVHPRWSSAIQISLGTRTSDGDNKVNIKDLIQHMFRPSAPNPARANERGIGVTFETMMQLQMRFHTSPCCLQSVTRDHSRLCKALFSASLRGKSAHGRSRDTPDRHFSMNIQDAISMIR